MPATDRELIERARALAPAIQARSAEAARMRRPHDDSIRELVEAEIIPMFVPKRWGGSEANLQTMFEVVRAISAACPSTGWIAAFYIMHNIYVTKFPGQAQEELFGKRGYVLLPAASAPDMSARKTEGGWRVSGRALWGSGIVHADWVMMSGNAEDGQRAFLMPVEDVEILDTWHFTGMSGTGSNDYAAHDVFVPDHRTVPMSEFFEGVSEGTKLHDNPFYSIPFFIAAYCTILPVLTGSLEGALTAYEAIVERRVRNHTGTVVKDQQHVHITLGEFQIASRVAQDLARGVYDRSAAIMHKRRFTLEDRLDTKGIVAFVSNHCRDTANRMMTVCGSSSFHNDQPLQRIWRDLNTVCSHAFWDWDVTRELWGRRHLDLPLNNPLV
ncbi:acyl-CoA dehydrogenase family protein [Novosphingobium beihaiensis]|uniref:Acyl-CoA dehydrogenase C-terminal domain-containing protein n=1 Tax=Novosphingobium beihaiensis TaxID=2930389 RepID=A0ABT0BRD7_9SPHN|nr:acyl-CoA dehydrogenase family protein [Novosphingobium beihaiensis]MCJ2187601.1 hypothetical protein [Novosphingobium beihaiensis]